MEQKSKVITGQRQLPGEHSPSTPTVRWLVLLTLVFSGFASGQTPLGGFGIAVFDNPDPVPSGGLVNYLVDINNFSGTFNSFSADGSFMVGFGNGDLVPAMQTVTAFVDGSPNGTWDCTALSPGSFSCIPQITALPIGDLPVANHQFSFTGQLNTGMPPDNGQLTISCGPCIPPAVTTTTITGVAADFSMTADAVQPDPVNPNDTIDYQVIVTNQSPFPSSGPATVRVESNDVTLADTSSPDWLCSAFGGTGFDCTFIGIAMRGTGFNIGPGLSTTPLQISTTAPAVTGPFSATVTLMPPADNVTGPNPIVITRGVAPQTARLRATGNGPSVAPRATNATYTFSVQNFDDPGDPLDGKDSTGILLDIFFDEIPFNFSTTAQLTGFAGSGWSCFSGGQRNGRSKANPQTRGVALSYSCNWSGTLSLGQSTSSLQVMVLLPDNAPIDFQADARPFGTFYNPMSGDEAVVVTSITNVVDADLSLTKDASVSTVLTGEQFGYQLSVENLGPTTAFSATISDTLPNGVESLGFNGDDWACFTSNGNTVACDYTGSGIDVGDTSFLNLIVSAPDTGGTITNTARVTSSQDIFPDNNTGSVDVIVVTEQMINLSLSKQSMPTNVIPGGQIDYLLTVINDSSSVADGVEVIDVLPPGVQFISASGMNWMCSESMGTVNCVNNQLLAEEISTIIISVTAPDSSGTIANTASVTAAQTEVDPTDNSATAETVVESGTDLSVIKTASSASVDSGDTVSFDIVVTNGGSVQATGVHATDNLPLQFSLDTIVANGWNCDVLSSQVVCSLIDPLDPGAMALIALTGHVNGDPGSSFTNQVNVSADQPDPNSANNFGSATVSIPDSGGGAPADLVLTMTDSEDPVLTGNNFDYLLNVRNDGPAQVDNFQLFDNVPAGLAIQSTTTLDSGTTCTVSGQQVMCNFIGNMSPGDELDVTITVTAPDEESTVTNSAFLQVSFSDPNGANNIAEETTEIRFTPTEEELQEDLNNALGGLADPVVVGNLDPIANLCADPLLTVADLCREIAEALDDGRQDEVAEAIRQTVGQLTSSQHTSMVEAGIAQSVNVDGRLKEVRGGRGGGTVSVAGLNVRMGRQSMPIGLLQDAFSDDEAEIDSQGLIKPWGFFINGSIGGGDHDASALEEGFDFDTLGITAGVDYRPSLNGVIGAAIGWADFESDFIDGSILETDGLTLSVYGSYYPRDNIYVDGRLSFGSMDLDQRRRIRFDIGNLSVDDVAFGSTEADQWSGSMSVGYIINRDTWNFTPSAGLSIFEADIDPFTEVGSDLALTYQGQEVESMIANASLSISKVFSLSRGVFTPQFDFSFYHEADNDNNSLNSQIIGSAASSAFFIDSDRPDTNYSSASLGFVFVGANGKQAYLTYREILGLSGFSRWTVNVGMRFEF